MPTILFNRQLTEPQKKWPLYKCFVYVDPTPVGPKSYPIVAKTTVHENFNAENIAVNESGKQLTTLFTHTTKSVDSAGEALIRYLQYRMKQLPQKSLCKMVFVAGALPIQDIQDAIDGFCEANKTSIPYQFEAHESPDSDPVLYMLRSKKILEGLDNN